MANVIDTRLLYNPVAEEQALQKEYESTSPTHKKLAQMNLLTKILIWRTASLLKIAAFIYRERIASLEKEERDHKRRSSIANKEYKEYLESLIRARSKTHHRLVEHKATANTEVHDHAWEKFYDTMINEVKNEHPDLKLSKFITEVEERTRLKEILEEKRKRRGSNSSGISTPPLSEFKTIRRRNAALSSEIKEKVRRPLKQY